MADRGASLEFIRTASADKDIQSNKKNYRPTQKVIIAADFDKATAVFVRRHGVVRPEDFDSDGLHRFQVENLSVVFSLSRDTVAEEMLQLSHKRRGEIKVSLAGAVIDVDFFVPKEVDKKTVSRAKYDEVVSDQTYIDANPSLYRSVKSSLMPS